MLGFLWRNLNYIIVLTEQKSGCLFTATCTVSRVDLQKVQGKEQRIYNNSKATRLEAAIIDGKISINWGAGKERGNTF